MAGLLIKQSKDGEELTVTFSGDIDESATYSEINLNGITKLVLDTEGLKSINSWGVKEWVRWTRTFPKGIEVRMVECASALIDQINMIAGFLPKGAMVESFFVPYYCNGCGHSGEYLFESNIDVKNGNIVETKSAVCEKCNGPAEWDIIANTYFRFLKNK